MVKNGLSLVEVIVAMTLLSIGALAVAASSIVSMQTFTRAELQERALREAEGILDSLVNQESHSAGSRSIANAQLNWTGGNPSGELTVTVRLQGREPFELTAVR